MSASSRKAPDRRLLAYVACGFLAGAVFVGFDIYSESMIGEGTISEPHAGMHFVVDHLLPLVVGPLLGVSAHYVRIRSQLAVAMQTAARADALRSRLQRVERDQALWVLAATVLHELNNPLHALRLLLDEIETEKDQAAVADLLARARAQTERLVTRLRALRAMRSMTEPQISAVQLGRALAPIAEDANALAAEDGCVVRLAGDESVSASADPAYLRTIVENLLDNSLHALRSGGSGAVVVEVSAEPERAVVRVSDDGPTLSPEARGTLFEPLSSTKQNGLGLGLPIARALARAMGGELSLETGPEKAFRLELPLWKPA